MTSTQSSASSGSLNSPSRSLSGSECLSLASRSSRGFSTDGDKRDAAVGQLVASLFSYEELLQRIFAEGGRLATAAIEAQAGQNLSPLAGHQILAAISNAQVAVTGALRHMAEGHRLLETLGQNLGMDVEAFGDVIKRPKGRGTADLNLAA